MGKKNKRRREDNRMPPLNKAIWDAVNGDQWSKLLINASDEEALALLERLGFKEGPKDGKPESWWRGLTGKCRKGVEGKTRRVVIMVEP